MTSKLAGILLLLSALFLPGAPIAAQEPPRFGGFLQLDRRFELGGDELLTADFYNRFRPELMLSPTSGLYMTASLDVRFYDLPATRSLADLEGPERNFPTELTVWEAYVQASDFLLPGMDLRVGKQRIQWGTADKLNPTDQIDAYDLSDITSFTERIPTWSAMVEYYLPAGTLTAIWSPVFHPPLLPRGGSLLMLDADGLAEAIGAPIRSIEDRLVTPSRRLGSGRTAVKFSGFLAGFDVSLSYAAGYDALPILRRLELVPVDELDPSLGFDARMELGFVRTRTAGFDFATEVGGIGIWGEGALLFPEKVWTDQLVGTGSGALPSRDVALEDRSFLRSTVGFDYTFRGGWYLNGQWAHGLFFERGAGDLHDYFIGSLEKPLFGGGVTVRLGGGLEMERWSKGASANSGYILLPEITFKPVDNLEIASGAFLVDGRGRSLFRRWDAFDQAFLRMKVTF